MSLTHAIDALLKFTADGELILEEGERRERFDALDRDVYVEAARKGWDTKLPTFPVGDCQGLGMTHLPGLWTFGPRAFHPVGLSTWRSCLLALRALGEIESTSSSKSSEQPAVQLTNELALPALTDNDEVVLLYLLKRYPHLTMQAETTAGTGRARATVSESLKRLRAVGLVDRPKGERKGDRLTDKGKQCAERLQNSPIRN